MLKTKPSRYLGVSPLTPEYLNPREAATLTGFTARALEAMRARGIGPRFFKVGASVRYRPADLRAWIESDVGRK